MRNSATPWNCDVSPPEQQLPPHVSISYLIAQFLLNREQASAVRLLCFQLLLGGGGCGKSYAINAVLSFAKFGQWNRGALSVQQQVFFFFLKFIHYFIKYNNYVYFQSGIAAVLLQPETVHSALRLARDKKKNFSSEEPQQPQRREFTFSRCLTGTNAAIGRDEGFTTHLGRRQEGERGK